MHIAVVIRIVPDLSEELEVDAEGTDIDREWIGLKLNEFDDHALEEAVLLKEAAGATVTVLALAGEGAERQLQTAVARGADAGQVVAYPLTGMMDARAAALLLAPAIEALGADLVLTGVQTPEDVFGQLASYLGGALGRPVINAVNGVAATGGGLEVTQEYSGGHATRFAVAGPVVLGIQTASKPPRYVSGSKLRQVSGMAIPEVAADLPAGFAPQRIAGLSEPERGAGAEMIAGSAEEVAEKLVEMLAGRKLVGA